MCAVLRIDGLPRRVHFVLNPHIVEFVRAPPLAGSATRPALTLVTDTGGVVPPDVLPIAAIALGLWSSAEVPLIAK